MHDIDSTKKKNFYTDWLTDWHFLLFFYSVLIFAVDVINKWINNKSYKGTQGSKEKDEWSWWCKEDIFENSNPKDGKRNQKFEGGDWRIAGRRWTWPSWRIFRFGDTAMQLISQS